MHIAEQAYLRSVSCIGIAFASCQSFDIGSADGTSSRLESGCSVLWCDCRRLAGVLSVHVYANCSKGLHDNQVIGCSCAIPLTGTSSPGISWSDQPDCWSIIAHRVQLGRFTTLHPIPDLVSICLAKNLGSLSSHQPTCWNSSIFLHH